MEIINAVTWWESRALGNWLKSSTQNITSQVDFKKKIPYGGLEELQAYVSLVIIGLKQS